MLQVLEDLLENIQAREERERKEKELSDMRSKIPS